MNVYLSGPIDLVSEQEATEWRREAAMMLAHKRDEDGNPVVVLDPTKTKFMTPPNLTQKEDCRMIVEHNQQWIGRSTVMLVNANSPGWGTAMEVYFAYQEEEIIIAFSNNPKPSAWLTAHVHGDIYPDLSAAIDAISNIFDLHDTN